MVLAFTYSRRYNTRPIVNVVEQISRDRAWVEINLANLTANARTVQQAAGGARLLPMVKADAYGLGAVPAVRALEQLDPWGFGVATLNEAAELRESGVSRPIIVFTPAVPDLRSVYEALELRAVLDDPAVSRKWGLPFHLEVDTGMGRCGIRYDDGDRLAAVDRANLEGVFTHFFAADDAPETVLTQWNRFERVLEDFANDRILVHAQNSAGSWRLTRRLDLVRPGIFLYGGRCGSDLAVPKPVASVRARVISIRHLKRGATVSYGAEWSAPRDTTVATLGVGYADGVKWTAKGNASVLLRGTRYPVVGRITMDFVMVDLGPAGDDIPIGEVATLIGRDGDEEITVDEFAGWAGTISYEVLTGLRGRLPREYSPL
jgi:alanine racemase